MPETFNHFLMSQYFEYQEQYYAEHEAACSGNTKAVGCSALPYVVPHGCVVSYYTS